MDTVKLDDTISRGAAAVRCPKCRGYASEVEATAAEISQQICGRSWACCIGAFKCESCGQRIVASREAPEME